MDAVKMAMLGLSVVLGSCTCSAQRSEVPFGQIERDAQLDARQIASARFDAEIPSLRESTAEPTEVAHLRPSPAANSRTLSSKYLLLNGSHLAMALFDVGMTQHCIAMNRCREGNPLMPSSLGGQLGVDFALVGYGSFVSYRLKKRGNRLWWLSPTVGAAAHGVGVASSFH